jgi:hypothetical protein
MKATSIVSFSNTTSFLNCCDPYEIQRWMVLDSGGVAVLDLRLMVANTSDFEEMSAERLSIEKRGVFRLG